MTSWAELQAALISRPDDPQLARVCADWFNERGDPRGRLIDVQLDLEVRPTDEALRTREAELLADHRVAFLGGLAQYGRSEVGLGFRRGFVRDVRLGPPLEEYAACEAAPAPMIDALARLPFVELVQSLIIGGFDTQDFDEMGRVSWRSIITALAATGLPLGVSRLEFDCGGYWDISTSSLGSLAPLANALEQLRVLRIRMGAMTLGPLRLPRLRALEIVTGGLRRENVHDVLGGAWDSLERLSLCVGDDGGDDGCNVGPGELALLLDASRFPRLTHLGLANTNHADELVVPLARSALLRQLTSLDLSRGTFSDEGAGLLLQHADAFAHLAAIDLSSSWISAARQEQLRARLKPALVLTNQQVPDRDGDQSYRYVSISE